MTAIPRATGGQHTPSARQSARTHSPEPTQPSPEPGAQLSPEPEQTVLRTAERFAAAFNRHDIDAVLAVMTADCVFETTAPPDGVRHEGTAAVRAAFAEFFATSRTARFVTEEQVVCGDRVIVRWRYEWGDGAQDHVRGIDVLRIRDGLVAEKVSYVKG